MIMVFNATFNNISALRYVILISPNHTTINCSIVPLTKYTIKTFGSAVIDVIIT
jgi:hypothetical protein